MYEYDDEVHTATSINGSSHTTTGSSDTPLTIVVLSERTWVNLDTNGTVANWATVKTTAEPDTLKYTEYKLYVDQKGAETGKDLKDITLIDSTGWTADLKVNVANDTISGTIPYALTSETDENPVYLTYDASSRAWVLANDTSYNTPNKVKLTSENLPTSTGETAAATEPVYFANGVDDKGDYISDLYLIIDRNGHVTVYYGDTSAAATTVNANKLVVTNEDGNVNFDTYTFELDVADPNPDAYFESFSINGSKGVIDNTNHTIEVTLPYGTEYTYLKPVFTTSSGAVVAVDDPTAEDEWVRSGITDINFSTKRIFTVHAEDEKHTTVYTVTVKVADQFTDVNPDDWFYENVMGAAQNGYVTGEGNGIFNPYGKTTRAAFACMIANVMGFDAENSDLEIETAFPDVPANHWGAKAIAFCVENGYLSGYEDGTFQPDKAITRQEAAAILNNTFELEASSDVSMFTDAGKIASWATSHVAAVANAELMNGDAAGTFRPTDYIIRAEAASILMNAKNHGYID